MRLVGWFAALAGTVMLVVFMLLPPERVSFETGAISLLLICAGLILLYANRGNVQHG